VASATRRSLWLLRPLLEIRSDCCELRQSGFQIFDDFLRDDVGIGKIVRLPYWRFSERNFTSAFCNFFSR
jgi:hypothetical protein